MATREEVLKEKQKDHDALHAMRAGVVAKAPKAEVKPEKKGLFKKSPKKKS